MTQINAVEAPIINSPYDERYAAEYAVDERTGAPRAVAIKDTWCAAGGSGSAGRGWVVWGFSRGASGCNCGRWIFLPRRA